MQLWVNEAHLHKRSVRTEAIGYGLDPLDPDELARIAGLEDGPKVQQRAREADAYWSERSPAFRSRMSTTRKRGARRRTARDMLTLEGLYTGLYRGASQPAHGLVQSLDLVVDVAPTGPNLVHRERENLPHIARMAVPLLALALIGCGHALGWPSEDAVREISDAFLRRED